MRLDSACKYTKNNANHNPMRITNWDAEVGFLLQIYKK